MKEEIKKFIIFAYNDYYPNGGLDDMKDSFDTLKEAIAEAKKEYKSMDFIEIVDKDTWKIVIDLSYTECWEDITVEKAFGKEQ